MTLADKNMFSGEVLTLEMIAKLIVNAMCLNGFISHRKNSGNVNEDIVGVKVQVRLLSER